MFVKIYLNILFLFFFNNIFLACKPTNTKEINTSVLNKFDKDILKNKTTIQTNQNKITDKTEETLSIKALCKDKEYSNKNITIIVEEEALKETLTTDSEGKFQPSSKFYNKKIICENLPCIPVKIKKDATLEIRSCSNI